LVNSGGNFANLVLLTFQLDQGGLGLARDQYLNKSLETDKVLQAYLTYMTTVGVLLGGEYNDTRQQMMEVMQFEKQLAEVRTLVISKHL